MAPRMVKLLSANANPVTHVSISALKRRALSSSDTAYGLPPGPNTLPSCGIKLLHHSPSGSARVVMAVTFGFDRPKPLAANDPRTASRCAVDFEPFPSAVHTPLLRSISCMTVRFVLESRGLRYLA